MIYIFLVAVSSTVLLPLCFFTWWESQPSPTFPAPKEESHLHQCSSKDDQVDWEFFLTSGDFFRYAIVQNRPSPLKVAESEKHLCSPPKDVSPTWSDCLPINPSTDPARCLLATRTELLKTSPEFVGKVCMSAILDMILIDVDEVMHELGCRPLLTFGTALGASRNGTHIPHTDDIDLAYVKEVDEDCLDSRFTELLKRRGLYTFKDELIRVCIAPFHPLASNLYDIHHPQPCGAERSCGYVDVYPLVPYTGHKPYHREGKLYRHAPYDGYRMSEEQIWPLRSVSINGRKFETFADVEDLLERSYGKDFLHPKGDDEYLRDLGILV
ncbi:AP-1 complex subunit sigma-1A [Perkinsus olseni]|uniref:AP-1 complex subunit sigma-1A n=1 Tax=Perkinsus olseni TaxID=32597 RepID=A0A7J6TKP4_PEROL|nr:AP-1 complex subunit sigma-1A [Perkinsus olseni]